MPTRVIQALSLLRKLSDLRQLRLHTVLAQANLCPNGCRTARDL